MQKKHIIQIGAGIIVLVLILIGVRSAFNKSHPPVPTQVPVTLVDGHQCYGYTQEATATAPYSVHEVLDITIKGVTVTGTKKGSQSGPDMTNGYEGKFFGTLDHDTITGVFSYSIEGSFNKEQEIYIANTTGLEKLRYPLKESNDTLVPDLSKQPGVLFYPRIPCGSSK